MEKVNILVTSNDDEFNNQIFTILSKQEEFIFNIVKDEANMLISLEKIKPNVLIIELKKTIINEFELTLMAHRKNPSMSIIFICNKLICLNIAINSGINGILHKDVESDEIKLAIFTVLKGSIYISKPCTSYISKAVPPKKQSINSLPALSQSDISIINYLIKGYNDYEIAKKLNYNKGTIRNKILTIKKRLNLKNRIQIVLFSIAFGIIKPKLQDLFKTSEDKKNPDKA